MSILEPSAVASRAPARRHDGRWRARGSAQRVACIALLLPATALARAAPPAALERAHRAAVRVDSTPYVRAEPGDTSWVIGNGIVERRIAFGAAAGAGAALRTVAWRYLPAGVDVMTLARPRTLGRPDFDIAADLRSLGAPGALRLAGSRIAPLQGGGTSLVLQLRAPDRPLDVAVTYAVYAGHPVVRQWLAVTNRGDVAVVLSHLTVANVNAAPGRPESIALDGFYGTFPRESFYTGRVDDPVLVLRDTRTGLGMAAVNEAPGHLKRTESMGFASWGGGVQVMYDTDLFPFERRVAPGETWTSAAAAVLLFNDRAAGQTARDLLPAYASGVLNARRRAAGPLVVYDTWEPFNQHIDEALIHALVPNAARLGADVFVVDEGWETRLGDNAVDPARFPRGLDPVRDSVERHGMRFGIWAPLAATDTLSDAFRAHPEWAMRSADGRLKLTTIAGGHGVAVMDLASPYRRVAAARLDSLVRRYRPRYIKLDLTTAFNSYGESPGCYASGHDHASWAESLVRIYEGVQEIANGLRRAHPDLLVDISFEAWGQKHVIDHGLLAAADADWISNVEDVAPGSAGPRDARTLLYHRSLAVPTEAMLIGNLRADVEPAAERFATAIGATPLLLGDLRKVPATRLDWYGERMRWYKALRREVALDERFIPLGSWRQPRAGAWDGFARLSRKGEGLVSVFRNGSSDASVRVALDVPRAAQYRLRSVLDGRSLGTLGGAALGGGVPLALGSDGVVVLEVRRVGLNGR